MKIVDLRQEASEGYRQNATYAKSHNETLNDVRSNATFSPAQDDMLLDNLIGCFQNIARNHCTRPRMQNALRSHVGATWLVELDECEANNIESLRICLCLKNVVIQGIQHYATIVDDALKADDKRCKEHLGKS